jgi:hypothetical protein
MWFSHYQRFLKYLSMTAEIRRKTPTFRNLARDLPEPGSTVERMVATCWITNNVKPLPPQAVANGQAVCRACPAVWG